MTSDRVRSYQKILEVNLSKVVESTEVISVLLWLVTPKNRGIQRIWDTGK